MLVVPMPDPRMLGMPMTAHINPAFLPRPDMDDRRRDDFRDRYQCNLFPDFVGTETETEIVTEIEIEMTGIMWQQS
jgi:hypothetical protein